nr:hypothetical protein [uncultured Acetatifactor sp.]
MHYLYKNSCHGTGRQQKGMVSDMKNNPKQIILTAICALMLFIPWTILPLRSFPWALESPTAAIMISCYAAFMVFSGVFTAVVYAKGKIQHTLMKICVVINGIYALGGVIAFALMAYQGTLPFANS